VTQERVDERKSDRTVRLCEQLAAATSERGVQWEVDSADTFLWRRPEGSVEITSRDHDGVTPFELTVYNADGDKVEELASELVGEDEPAAWNDVLAWLYRGARRSALHGDEIIDALLSALPSRGVEAQNDWESPVATRTQ
jgi:ankyrin repeat protein